MAWTRVSGNRGTAEGGATTTVVVTLTGVPLVGNLLVVSSSYTNNLAAVSSIADDAGNSYAAVNIRQTSGKSIAQWTGLVVSVPTAITVTFGNTAGNKLVGVREFNGGAGQNANEDSATTGNNTTGGPNVTWTVNNDGVLGLADTAYLISADDITDGSGWETDLAVKHSGANYWIHLASNLNLSAGSNTYNPSIVSGASWATAIDAQIPYASATLTLPVLGG